MRALRSRSRARRGSIARPSRSARAARVWSWSRSREISTCAVPRSCGIGSIASTSTTRTKTRTTAIPIPACTSTLAASPRTQRDTQQHTHPSTRRNMPRSTRPDTRANTRGPTVGHTRTPTSGSVRQSTNRGDSMRTVLIASALSLRALTSATAQDFNWHGRLAAGKRLEVKGVNGDVRASSVNGSVRVSTTGLAEASTVNGSVTAEMGRANWTNVLEFSTVNGGITLTLPPKLDTDVQAKTVNGEIESDYPLMVTGRFGPRRLRGTIGAGGRSLNLSTVNGEIRLKKGTD